MVDERIKNIMASVFDVNVSRICSDTSADALEQWDSLSHMCLVVALEEEFVVKFSSDEIVEMLSFSSIKEMLQKKNSSL
jgi:acyl carrier protein